MRPWAAVCCVLCRPVQCVTLTKHHITKSNAAGLHNNGACMNFMSKTPYQSYGTFSATTRVCPMQPLHVVAMVILPMSSMRQHLNMSRLELVSVGRFSKYSNN